MPTTDNQIVKALSTREPMTATALAKKLGMTKARDGFKNQLSNLVAAGSVIESLDGRYATYLKAPKSGSGNAVASTPSGTTKTTAVGQPTAAKNVPQLPEVQERVIRNYKISSTKKGKVVTTPNGKRVTMKDEDFLVVINEEPLYVVKDAADVMTCIREYANEKGMRTFVVSDLAQSKSIGTKKDVASPEDHVLFLEIKRHNKAA